MRNGRQGLDGSTGDEAHAPQRPVQDVICVGHRLQHLGNMDDNEADVDVDITDLANYNTKMFKHILRRYEY